VSLSQRLLKFIASRFHVPPDALDYFFASQHIGHGAATMLPYPAELIPIGARLVLRGWLNHKFFPSHRDWILPYWAEQQFDPRARAFIPTGFDLYTINYTHRDWTMIGNLGRAREAIVDPRGLVTPWFDGWSLDVWLKVDGKLFAPSRLADAEVEQSLHEHLPIVVTKYRAGEAQVELETFAAESNEREWVVENIAVTNASSAARRVTVYLAFRPFNPEGVSLINKIETTAASLRRHPERSETQSKGRHWDAAGILINSALAAIIPPPDAFAASTLDRGDIAHSLQSQDRAAHATDKSGLATAVAAYHLDLGSHERKTISALLPMTREEIQEDDPSPLTNYQLSSSADLRLQTISTWHDKLSRGMRVQLPDEKLSNAFEANKAYLLLFHDGDTITPGPFTYHQFWMRDAAYLLNALDKLGYHGETRAVIEKFPKRIQKDGYVRSTEGEWDSNGAAIWTMLEHARLSGNNELLMTNYWSLLRMASWINSKRRQTTDDRRQTNMSLRAKRSNLSNRELEIASSQQTLLAMTRTTHHGLLPPGPSAEHLGPADYFYWDGFWGLAGLREAARAAEILGETQDAIKLRANYESFRADIEASLAITASRLGRQAMPASPYRQLDAGAIGSLVAAYPLRLFDPNDPRVVDTIAALKENGWMEDAYFNHVGHAALGTYLSLHVAQCLLMQRNPDAWKIINWVLHHASPTFTWAEGIHPGTRNGGMGDGHHGWAAADFVLAVRNALLLEEENHLVITPIMPQDWVAENNIIKVERAATYFGDVNFTIAFGDHTATLVVRSDWRTMPEFIEWCLPFTPREAGDDAQIIGNAVRLPRGSGRTVVTW